MSKDEEIWKNAKLNPPKDLEEQMELTLFLMLDILLSNTGGQWDGCDVFDDIGKIEKATGLVINLGSHTPSCADCTFQHTKHCCYYDIDVERTVLPEDCDPEDDLVECFTNKHSIYWALLGKMYSKYCG